VPPAVCRDSGETSTLRAARASRLPSPATVGRGPAPCGPRVRRHRCVAISARRARSVPLARRKGPHLAARVYAASGESRSRQGKHPSCRSRVAPALTGCGRQRISTWRPASAPPAVRCERGEASTLHAARASRRQGACWWLTCVPPAVRRDCETSTFRAARASCRPSPSAAEGTHLAASAYAASGASGSRRGEHAPCRSRVAPALPGCSRQRARTWRPACLPPAVCRERGEASTLSCASRRSSPVAAYASPASGPRACASRLRDDHAPVPLAYRARPSRLQPGGPAPGIPRVCRQWRVATLER
jgi:hypothetical protein